MTRDTDRLGQACAYLQRFKFIVENLPGPPPPLVEAITCLGAAVDALAAELEAIRRGYKIVELRTADDRSPSDATREAEADADITPRRCGCASASTVVADEEESDE